MELLWYLVPCCRSTRDRRGIDNLDICLGYAAFPLWYITDEARSSQLICDDTSYRREAYFEPHHKNVAPFQPLHHQQDILLTRDRTRAITRAITRVMVRDMANRDPQGCRGPGIYGEFHNPDMPTPAFWLGFHNPDMLTPTFLVG